MAALNYEEILPCFENLDLNNPFRTQASSPNYGSPSSSQNKLEQWRRIIEDDHLPSRCSSYTTECLSRGFSPSRIIWADDSFTRGGETCPTCNSWNQQHGGRSYSCSNNMLNGDQSSCYIAKNNYEYSCFPRLNGGEEEAPFVLSMVKTKQGSLELQNILKFGTPKERQKILEGVLKFLFEVMTDRYGQHLFLKLLEFCDSGQFRTIFVTLTSNTKLLLRASLLKYSTSAVQGFIKKLKKSGLAHYITSILSTRFLQLMISEHGRYVVHQCFYTFTPKENEVLINCTIRYFKELATTFYGCSSLNISLSCISGAKRLELLQSIAEASDFLANDPYGIFVVQEVLMLKNNEITCKICDRLKMHYTHLAVKKRGSDVVQQCIQTSDYGLKSVVYSLLENENTFVILACHEFGKSVIETALKIAKTRNVQLYQSLVAVAKAKSLDLSSSTVGEHIWNLVKSLESNNVEEHTQF